MCTVWLWKKANCLHICQPNTAANLITFLPKKIPSVVHFYANRQSMLVLSEPCQGGKCERKKGEVVYIVCVCHGKHTQWKEILLFSSGNRKHFLVSVQANQNTFGYSRLNSTRSKSSSFFNGSDIRLFLRPQQLTTINTDF